MKRTILYGRVLVGCIVLLGFCAMSIAQEKSSADPVQEAMMTKMQQFATPAEGHKRLEVLIGSWKHTVKWRMSPQAPTEESQGTNENRWILGNRFVSQDVKGQMKEQPFEGVGITGYDNLRGEYSSVWLDTMGTGIMTATAQFNPAENTFQEQGSFSCPLTGEAHRAFRATWKIIDNDHYTYEMYMKDPSGKEFKNMEITYERL